MHRIVQFVFMFLDTSLNSLLKQGLLVWKESTTRKIAFYVCPICINKDLSHAKRSLVKMPMKILLIARHARCYHFTTALRLESLANRLHKHENTNGAKRYKLWRRWLDQQRLITRQQHWQWHCLCIDSNMRWYDRSMFCYVTSLVPIAIGGIISVCQSLPSCHWAAMTCLIA